jgi:hypothetical protein
MSDFDPNAVLRETGQLFVDVTDLSADNYGGTPLGFFERGEQIVDEESEDVYSEATGKRVRKLIAETLLGFEFDLVQYDLDALKKVWAYASTTLREPALGATRAPGLQSAGLPCLFVPADVLTHPALLVYAPVYRAGRKRVSYGSMDDKRRERIFIDAMDNNDGAGKVWACDVLANLSLA